MKTSLALSIKNRLHLWGDKDVSDRQGWESKVTVNNHPFDRDTERREPILRHNKALDA